MASVVEMRRGAQGEAGGQADTKSSDFLIGVCKVCSIRLKHRLCSKGLSQQEGKQRHE